MRTVLLAALLLAAPAWGAEAPDKDWWEVHQLGIKRANGGLAAGGGGIAVGLMAGAVVLIAGGCGTDAARNQETCEGAWLPDGLAVAGIVVGTFGAGALNAADVKARRGLVHLGYRVTSAPMLLGWGFTLAAAVSTVGWIGLARPSDPLPLMPAVRDHTFLALNGGLLAAAYGLGIVGYVIVKKKGQVAERERREAVVVPQVVPWASRSASGVAWVGRF